MNLIDKDALIESLGIETDCYDCEHETIIYHCDLDPVEACTKIVEAPVISVTTESAEKAIEVLKNAAWLGAVYSFEETEEAVKTAIRALQVASAQPNVQDSVKDADCISRQAAIDAIDRITRTDNWQAAVSMALLDLPSAQPEVRTQMSLADCISRQQAIDALNGIINRFEQILRDIRESKGDDSVCGMCEYDGAYIGQSGDWCNECPGFDKDDCFKLSDKCRKRWLKSVDLPSAQPETNCSEFPNNSDTISRQAAIDAEDDKWN